jgi:hypothetical protein
MARERMIYPEMLDSESYQSLTSDGKVLWLAIILMADDWGRGKVCELSIKGRVFPRNNKVSPKMVGELLKQFEKLEFINTADFGLSRYYYVKNWDKYQHLKYRRDSKIPAFPRNLPDISPKSPGNQGNFGAQDGMGRDGMGCDGMGRDVIASLPQNLGKIRETFTPKVPEALQGLPLYEADAKLCARWTELLAAWTKAYPGVDIAAQVKAAHAWETSDKARRKVNHGSFLNNWLRRAQTDAWKDSGHAGRQRTEKEIIGEMFQ